MLQRVYTRVSKGVARYSPRGSAAEHCSACRFFMSGGDCARVLGRVMPGGWCKYFSREAVQRWNPLWPMEGIPAPPGATLDLSFLTSGSLDPRITFTRASTATYFNYAGVMQTAAANAPRWDYDPVTHALRGLLIEEARTNAVWSSTPGIAANWATVGTTTAFGGSILAPDGTVSTTSLVAASSTTSDVRQVINAVAVGVSGTTYTASAYLKTTSTANAHFQINAGGAAAAYFDLTAGTGLVGADLGAGITNKSVAITPCLNGWYRVAFTFTPSATGGIAFYIGPCTTVSSSGDNRPYIGVVGQGIYVWGAQVEQGAFPTSLIPTTAAAVTRAADMATMPTAAWFNTTSGTYQAECIPNGNAAAAPFIVGGNAGSPVIGIGGDGLLSTAIRAVVGIHGGAGPLFAFGSVDKAALAYISGASTAAVNGTTLAANAATFTTPLAGTLVALGGDGNTPGTLVLNGWLRRVKYWPRVLSNTEMQAVTT